MKGERKIFPPNKQKRAEAAILIAKQTKSKKLTRDKNGYYMLVNDLLQQEDIIIINPHTSTTCSQNP